MREREEEIAASNRQIGYACVHTCELGQAKLFEHCIVQLSKPAVYIHGATAAAIDN